MVAKTTRTVIILRNPRSYQQFLHPSTEKSCSYTVFKSSNCKAYNYHKVAGDNFWIHISAIPRMQQCSINIVSLNEHMALNLNEFICSLNEHISLNGYNVPERIGFHWMRIYFLERTDKVPWNENIFVSEYNCLEWLYFLWINICSLNESVFPWHLTSISFSWSWINTIPWSCINIQLLDVKECLGCKYILFNLNICISWISCERRPLVYHEKQWPLLSPRKMVMCP